MLLRPDGPPVPRETLLAEARVLWLEKQLNMLWFSLARALDGKVDWTNDREADR